MMNRYRRFALSVLVPLVAGLTGCKTVVSFNGLGDAGRVRDESVQGRWFAADEETADEHPVGGTIDIELADDGYEMWLTDEGYGDAPVGFDLNIVREGDIVLFDIKEMKPNDDWEPLTWMNFHHLGVVEWSEKGMVFRVLLDLPDEDVLRAAGVSAARLDTTEHRQNGEEEHDATDAAWESGTYVLVGSELSLRRMLVELAEDDNVLEPIALARQRDVFQTFPGRPDDRGNLESYFAALEAYDPLLARHARENMDETDDQD